MIKRLASIATLLLFACLLTAVMPTAKACACVDPMPEEELAALKLKAASGDFDAIGAVYQEYFYARGDRNAAAVWARRAVKAGAPLTLLSIADHYIERATYSDDLRIKAIYVNSALAMLERGSQKRDKIKSDSNFDNKIYFANALRRARSLSVLLESRIESLKEKANSGDAIAAYYVALYYFNVKMNQKQRTIWESRASRLGDPYFAGNTVDDSRTVSEDLRDISKALKRSDIIARTGDGWMQARFREDLRARRKLLLSPRTASASQL